MGHSVRESTALEMTWLGTAALCVRLACTRNQQSNPRPLNRPIPQPKKNTTRKHAKINMATRTIATSEDRDSEIRQRCGCKK